MFHSPVSVLGMFNMAVLCGSVVKNPSANTRDVRDVDSILGSRRSPGGGNGNALQYSCLENPMDREACWTTVHGVAKSQTQLCMKAYMHVTHCRLFQWSELQCVYMYKID